jgi:hypothetical protein
MLMKVIALAEGFSGVRLELVEKLCALINHRIYPRIPSRGSVGASRCSSHPKKASRCSTAHRCRLHSRSAAYSARRTSCRLR